MHAHAQDQEASGSFLDRILGILKLDRPAYERIAADPNALTQAVGIVIAAAIANGIAQNHENGLGIVGGFLAGIVGWVAISAAVLWIGQKVSGPETDVSFQRSLRLFGFAIAPGILYALTPIPLGGLINIAASIWAFVTYIVAVQVLAQASVGKALLVLTGAVFITGLAIMVVTAPFIM